MDSNTLGVVEALTMVIEHYVGLMSSAIFNIFKFTFCTFDSTGQITGLNFLGSIVVLFLGITILGVLIKILFESFTPWHHEEEFISEESDIMNKTEEVLPTPIEQTRKKIDIIAEQKQMEKERLELERLKELRRARKKK